MNPFEKLKYQYFFQKSNYLEERTEGVEIRYYSSDRKELVVKILDNEVGKKCYPILKEIIKKHGDNGGLLLLTFGFSQIDIIEKNESVKKIIFRFEDRISTFNKMRTIREEQCRLLLTLNFTLDRLISAMGYGLGDYSPENFNSISGFFASLTLAQESYDMVRKRNNDNLIRYAHYLFTDGGDLNEFYEHLWDEDYIYEAVDLPYCKDIVALCYNCYKGNVPRTGLEEAFSREMDKLYGKSLIVNPVMLKEEQKICCEDDYTICFSEGYTLFKEDVSEKDKINFFDAIKWFSDKLLEKRDKIIYDLQGNVIGFTRKKEMPQSKVSVYDMEISSELKIYDFVCDLESFLLVVSAERYNKEFDISKDVAMVNDNFKIPSIFSLFRIIESSKNKISKQIATLYIYLCNKVTKKYFDYEIEQKYGNCKNGMIKQLSKGNMLIMFKDAMEVENFLKEDTIKENRTRLNVTQELKNVKLEAFVFSNESSDKDYKIAGIIISGIDNKKIKKKLKNERDKEQFDKVFCILKKDQYASYYFDKEENIHMKIYNEENVDMKRAEENITKIVIKRFFGQDMNETLGQDYFIPQKILCNSEGIFIGYTYIPPVELNEKICIELRDTKLPNATKAKLLLKVIRQILEVMKSNGVSFFCNPFTYAFLVKGQDKIQFLNIEFLDSESYSKESFEWLIEYVKKVIKSDDTLSSYWESRKNKFEGLSLEQTIKEFNLELEKFVSENTQYCKIHNMYYSKNEFLCPKCSGNIKIPVEDVDINLFISKSSKIGRGGEASVYNFKDGQVVKVFNESVNFARKANIIARLFSKKNILEGENQKDLKYHYVLPQKVIKTDKGFAYVMPKVEGNRISVLRDVNVVKELGITRKDIFEILITLGEGIEFLHEKANITIGDLNGGNIVFDSNKNVYFIDFDGMGIDEYMPTAYTPGYIDPISEKNHQITMKDDWYSFAIHAFYYLTYSHPFSGIYNEAGSENAVTTNMAIDMRMEKKLSLLGKHGIEPPSLTEPWYWMDEQLINKFLAIFEGDDRTSILPMLKEQYEKLSEEVVDSKDECEPIIRINPKLVAKEIGKFNNAKKIVNSKAAICYDSTINKKWISFSTEQYTEVKYYPENVDEIKDILVDEYGGEAWIIYSYFVVKLELENLQEECMKMTGKIKHAAINENKIYITMEQENGILVIDEKGNKEIIFEYDNIIAFFVIKNSKIVTIRESKSSCNKVEIYFNSRRVAISKELPDIKNMNFKIEYDKITKLCCFIVSEGWGMIFGASYISKIFSIKGHVNIENAKFINENLFIPEEGFLYCIDTKSNALHDKKLECKIFNNSSKLCDMDIQGFTVINENKMYRICKE